MARIRSIKPEFPQSESMGRVSRDARLLFVLLWTIADDHGRTRAHSRMLASLLFPYDDDAGQLMNGWLDELEKEGCIRLYEASGSQYLEIVKWTTHQKIDKPSKPQFPIPAEHSENTREDSVNVRETLALEGKGEEGKGEEGKEPRKKPEPKSKGSRIPTDWQLTPDLLAEARRIGPSVDAQREAAKFRDYWLAASGQNAVKADWDATWRNWIRRAADGPPGTQPIRTTPADSPASSRPL